MRRGTRAWAFFILIFAFTLSAGCAGAHIAYCAEDETEVGEILDSLIESRLESSTIDSLKKELEKYSSKDMEEITDGLDWDGFFAEAVKGRYPFNFESILNNLFKFFFNEIYLNAGILVRVVLVAVILALLKNLQTSFMGKSASEIAFFAAYTVMVSMLMVSFEKASGWGIGVINDMSDFMFSSFPVLVALLAASGNFLSAGVVKPLVVAAVNIAVMLLKNIFIPMIILSTVFSVLNNISDKIQLSYLADTFRKICTWGLGLVTTVFVNFIAIQSAVSGTADGVTGKTVKFAINSLPVVGKYLSDATDTVMSCSFLIKNTAHAAVLTVILFICIVPVLRIFALALLYRLTAVIVEPISDKRITNCIVEISKSMIYVAAVAAAVALMFMITVTVIIGAGKAAIMIR